MVNHHMSVFVECHGTTYSDG